MRHGKDWRMLKCRWSDAPSNWSAPIGNFLSLEVYFFYIWLSHYLSRNESIWSYGKIRRLRRRSHSRHTQNNRWFVSDEAWELLSCTKELEGGFGVGVAMRQLDETEFKGKSKLSVSLDLRRFDGSPSSYLLPFSLVNLHFTQFRVSSRKWK